VKGFDISNSNEFSKVPKDLFYFITNCPLQDLGFLDQLKNDQYLVSCNSVYYFKIISQKNIPFVLRLKQNEKSHFGLNFSEVREIKNELRSHSSFSGFHFHHGGEANTSETYLSAIRKLKSLITELGIEKPLSLNLGGGFSHLSLKEIDEVFSYAGQELKGHKIVIEPGRYFTEETGQCFAEVSDIQNDGEGLIVNLNVSRECHLKWSRINQIKILKDTDSVNRFTGKSMRVYGNTCYEDDLIAVIHHPHKEEIAVGDTVVLSNISGYSLGWNTGFNGIPQIKIEFK